MSGTAPKGGSTSLRREVVHRDWILEQGIVARHHRDAAVGHMILLAVSLGVIADNGSLGDIHVAINDGLADAAVPADVDMEKNNTGSYLSPFPG
jgi:hypothetical protein